MNYLTIFIVFFILINLFTLYKLSFLAKSLKLIDKASGRVHEKDTPKFGFFLFGYIIIFLIFINFILDINTNLISLTLFYFSFFIIGYLDDRFEINVIKRFFLALTFVSIFYFINSNDYYVSNLFSLELNFFLLCFFTLGFVHLINITDGINGLVPLLFLYSLIYYFFKSFGQIDPYLEFLLIISIIGISIFIIPNFLGFCFLGNIGSYLVAVIIATIYMELFKENILEYSDILMIFYVPLLDGLRVSIGRVLKRKSPFKGDFTHLHHLVRGKYRWVFIYFLITFYPSFFNFFYKDYTVYISILSTISYFLLLKKHIR